MPEAKDKCVAPAKGIIAPSEAVPASAPIPQMKEAPKILARVGKPAPDFELPAFVDGGFKNIKLSDYKGK